MKKKILMTLGMVMILVLAACGDDGTEDDNIIDEMEETAEEIGDEVTQRDEVEEAADQDSSTSEGANGARDDLEAQLDALGFYDIEIDISYGSGQEFELDVERDDDDNKVKAEIDDDINNLYFEGQEAFDHVYPQLQTLDITTENSQEEVIENVLNAFDLADDYEKFEIEVYFNDGSKIDFEYRQ